MHLSANGQSIPTIAELLEAESKKQQKQPPKAAPGGPEDDLGEADAGGMIPSPA